MKLQDGLELGEGWKHISVNITTPVTGNNRNIDNLYQILPIYIKLLGPSVKYNRRTSYSDDRLEQRWYFPWWSEIPGCTIEGQSHLSKDQWKRDQQQVQPVLVELLWSGSLLAAPETQRGIGCSPGMVIFDSAWNPEATEDGAAQGRVWILWFPVDSREDEMSLGHSTVLEVYLLWHKTTY